MPNMQRRFAILSYLVAGLMVSVLAISTAGEARAQQGMSSGAFGSRNVGSSFSPAASNFSGSAAARGAAGGQGGLGALGAVGTGGSLAGATTRGDASAGQVTGNERFLRNNRRPGSFVGGDSADTNNIFSQLQGMAAQQGPRQQNQNSVSSLNV